MANVASKLIYGQADVTFGGNDVPAIAERVVFRAEPVYEDLTQSYEFGDVPLDKAIRGWNVTCEMAFAEESLAAINMAISTSEGVDSVDAQKKAYFDTPIGSTLSGLGIGAELKIHPRSEADDALDIIVFKAVPTGVFERVYGLEQGQIPVTFTGMIKDSADPTVKGNIFRIGPAITEA